MALDIRLGTQNVTGMRLNRYLASAGEGSRRSCEAVIVSGQVTVNGVVCTNLATQVSPTDVVKIGNRVLTAVPTATLILHKPTGFLCTASDTHGRRTIFDLLPSNFPRLFHVGRLDKESEGLLIVTNDGDLSLKLTHPRYKVAKEYEVVLDQTFDFALTAKLLRGITLEEGWAKMESVHRLSKNKLKVVLKQGMKRQIRLMFHSLGYEVIKLVRTKIGPIKLEGMAPASWRVLTQEEINALLAAGKSSEKASAPKRSDERPATDRPRALKPTGSRTPSSRSAGPRSAGPRSAGPRSQGTRTDAPRSAGPRAKLSRPATPNSSERKSSGPQRSGRPPFRGKSGGSASRGPRHSGR